MCKGTLTTMKLACSLLIMVICNAEQVRQRDSVEQPISMTPVYGKHLRLLAIPVTLNVFMV
jgi:hypothetical protein